MRERKETGTEQPFFIERVALVVKEENEATGTKGIKVGTRYTRRTRGWRSDIYHWFND